MKIRRASIERHEAEPENGAVEISFLVEAEPENGAVEISFLVNEAVTQDEFEEVLSDAIERTYREMGWTPELVHRAPDKDAEEQQTEEIVAQLQRVRTLTGQSGWLGNFMCQPPSPKRVDVFMRCGCLERGASVPVI